MQDHVHLTGLPYIGRSKDYSNLTIATGHGMLGISLAPITGKLVSEIISKTNTSIDIGSLNLNRF